jgi:predicted AlkP superfamily phosphohydrolase/phosphomutase
LLDDVLDIHEARIRNLLYLYEAKRPDVLCAVFTGTDVLQHTFAHVLDRSHPLYARELEDEYRPRIAKYLAMVDEFVVKLEELAGGDVRWLFLSDHGFCSLHKKVYVNRYLEQAGLFRFARAKRGLLKVAVPIAKKMGITRERVKGVLGDKDSEKTRALFDRISRQTGAVDWGKTKVFAWSTDGVYVNLRSRFPFGVVEDGVDYQRIRDEAKEVLLALRDPDGGRQVIDRVMYREEVYSGTELGYAPDLFLEVTDGPYQLSHAFNPQSGGIFESQSWQTGRHHKDGMILVAGNSVERGRIGGAIWDVAPTILHWMGQPIPDAMDGKPLMDAFTREFQERHEVKRCPSVDATAEVFEFTDEEKDELEKRLEGLGYLG